MIQLIPITKANDIGNSIISLATHSDFIVIRLYDLISSKTLAPNSTFQEIVQSGGLHAYYGDKRSILLSLIIPDEINRKFLPWDFAYFVNSLRPDYCTTIDCETYDKEESLSIEEMTRSIEATKILMDLCKDVIFIGHVKGCNKHLVTKHAMLLSLLGIKNMLFHTGDFFRYANPAMILKARNLAACVRPFAEKLFLYGLGSTNHFITFSFADYYITNTHFVTALKGKQLVGNKKHRYNGEHSLEIVESNLKQLHRNLESSKYQRKLFEGGGCPWAEAQEEIDIKPTIKKEE